MGLGCRREGAWAAVGPCSALAQEGASRDTKKGGTGRYKLGLVGLSLYSSGAGTTLSTHLHKGTAVTRARSYSSASRKLSLAEMDSQQHKGILHSISTSSTSKNSFAFGGILASGCPFLP